LIKSFNADTVKMIQEIERVPQTQEKHASQFKNTLEFLNTAQEMFKKNLDEKSAILVQEFKDIAGFFTQFDSLIIQINEFLNKYLMADKFNKLDMNDKALAEEKRKIQKKIRELNRSLSPEYQKRKKDRRAILLSLGNKL